MEWTIIVVLCVAVILLIVKMWNMDVDLAGTRTEVEHLRQTFKQHIEREIDILDRKLNNHQA